MDSHRNLLSTYKCHILNIIEHFYLSSKVIKKLGTVTILYYLFLENMNAAQGLNTSPHQRDIGRKDDQGDDR